MISHIKYSVLLSVYIKEHPSNLKKSIISLTNQTIEPDEIVIVKDGPLTNELEIIIEEYTNLYPYIKTIQLIQNQGLGKALNEGLKHCTYDIVARMDTDDIAKPNRFEKQIQIFQNNPDIDVVGTWIDEFENSTNNIISTRQLPENHFEIYQYAQKRNPINHPTVMFRKQAVIDAGGYQHFPLFEDYYLWIRMLLNGAKFYNIQESLLYFRFSPDMFKRRGGFKYACTEAKFQWHIHQLGFINLPKTIFNICIRFGTRIIPNGFRSWIYKNLLRK